MKVTYNWLKDFVEIKLAPQDLADKLTMAGIEVKSIEAKAGDFVLEIEITSNRPDWLSVVGVAREVAAITGRKLKLPNPVNRQPSTVNRKDHPQLSIHIEDKKDCLLYTATIIQGVKVAPSPAWLQERLELAGLRSVNNIVDITNYVLFEWGEPLHAFDLARMFQGKGARGKGQEMAVRRAKPGEELVTIDGVKRTLDDNILLIASDRPLALAGIMGGKDSEVSESTQDILLEAAIFEPVLVRRARQQLGLQSESSYRFERGVDRETAQKARARAISLLQEIAGGRISAAKASGLVKIKPAQIPLSYNQVGKVLGKEIKATKIKAILSRLGFAVKSAKKNSLLAGVPAHRQDIKKEIDLIEELARINGYEQIPTTLPKIALSLNQSRNWELIMSTKNILVASGLNEVITYSLVEKKGLGDFGAELSRTVEIANPLSAEQEILRPTLLLSLAKTAAFNLNQKQEPVQIFEISKAFSLAENSAPKEELVLGIALCGSKSWVLPEGRISYELGILDLKGAVENLFSRLGLKDYAFSALPDGGIVVLVNRMQAGIIRLLPKDTAQGLGIKNKNLALLELNLDLIFRHVNLERKFTPLPLYPGITRDLSILLKEEISAGAVLKAIQEAGGLILEEIKITDFYRGKQIPSGFKNLTISCFFRSPQRTLTESQVQPVLSQITHALSEKFGAQLR